VTPALCLTPTGSAIAYPSDPNVVAYDWGAGSGSTSSISGLVPGAHFLTLVNNIGCVFDNMFIVLPFGAIIAWASPDSILTTDGNAELMAGSSPPDSAAAYAWWPTEPLTAPYSSSTDASVHATTLFMVVVTSFAGCMDTAYAVVIYEPPVPCGEVFLPTMFSPNGDGLNDAFCPLGGCYETFELNIYDRWGALLFHGNALDPGWQGTYHGQLLPTGNYPYTFIADRTNGERVERIGQIAIAR